MDAYIPRHLKKDEDAEDREFDHRIKEEINKLAKEVEDIDSAEQKGNLNKDPCDPIQTVSEESGDDPDPFLEKDDGPVSPGRKTAILTGLIILLMIVSFAVPLLMKRSASKNSNEDIVEDTSNPMDPELRSMWLSNRKINEDYIGQIVFDSGLINLPFVQAKDVYKDDGELYVFFTEEGETVEDPSYYTGNDVYLWMDWKTGKFDRYEGGGSVFMDFRNDLDDQNIIIYGHHYARDYDPSGSKQFTPLDLLLTGENYEDNRYLSLILDNEIRRYAVVNVFTLDITDDYNQQIIRTDMDHDLTGNYDAGFFRSFIEYMNDISRYETDDSLTDSDRILTLITCLEHQPDYRQVVVCREIERSIYTD